MVKLTYRQRQKLPDSAFLLPKYRKLPYKRPNGQISLSHVRNALARADQVEGVPKREINAAIRKAETILLEHGGYERNGSGKMAKKKNLRKNFFKRKPKAPLTPEEQAAKELEKLRSDDVWRTKFRYYKISEGMPHARAMEMADESTREYWAQKKRQRETGIARNSRRRTRRNGGQVWDDEYTLSDLIGYFTKEENIDKNDPEEFDVFKEELIESIDDSTSGQSYAHWGDSATVVADGNEYVLVRSVDEAEDIARQVVKQDIEEEPGIFDQDFLSQHMSITPTDRRIIAGEEADHYYGDMDDEDVVEEYLRESGKDEEDIDGMDIDEMREDLAADYAANVERELEDPIEYFVNDRGIYTVEELMNQPWIYINSEAAAEEAVQIDGFAHFLSRYDGNYDETPGGIVVMRL